MAVFEQAQVATPERIGDIEIVAPQQPDGTLTLVYGVQLIYSDGAVREQRGNLAPIVDAIATDEQRAVLGAFVMILRMTAEKEMLRG